MESRLHLVYPAEPGGVSLRQRPSCGIGQQALTVVSRKERALTEGVREPSALGVPPRRGP